MNLVGKSTVVLAQAFVLLGCALVRLQAQSPAALAELPTSRALDPGAIVREIDDPSSHARWVLVRGSGQRGGPGQMLQVVPQSGSAALSVSGSVPRFVIGSVPTPGSYIPVIRAGDALALEEHTGVADIRLEGIALGPARLGAVLRAKLKVGGRIVRAVATGPGRATLAPDSEAWP